LFGNLAFIAIPLSLSGAMLIAAAALVFFLIREFGGGSVPRFVAIAKWAGCALIGVAAWKLAGLHPGEGVWSALPTAVVFTAVYCAAILTVFGEYRRILRAFLGAFAARLRLFH
jgi:hypothetical protein